MPMLNTSTHHNTLGTQPRVFYMLDFPTKNPPRGGHQSGE